MALVFVEAVAAEVVAGQPVASSFGRAGRASACGRGYRRSMASSVSRSAALEARK
jgi:hypothetical protein